VCQYVQMFPPKTAITDVARALAFGSHIVGIAKAD